MKVILKVIWKSKTPTMPKANVEKSKFEGCYLVLK